MSDWKSRAAQSVVDAGMRMFGEEAQATYEPGDGDPFDVDLIFEAKRERLAVGNDGLQVSSPTPVASINLSQFANPPARGDVIVIETVRYVVRDFEPDGPGVGGLLILHLED